MIAYCVLVGPPLCLYAYTMYLNKDLLFSIETVDTILVFFLFKKTNYLWI
jgi:hypothetical protein